MIKNSKMLDMISSSTSKPLMSNTNQGKDTTKSVYLILITAHVCYSEFCVLRLENSLECHPIRGPSHGPFKVSHTDLGI